MKGFANEFYIPGFSEFFYSEINPSQFATAAQLRHADPAKQNQEDARVHGFRPSATPERECPFLLANRRIRLPLSISAGPVSQLPACFVAPPTDLHTTEE